MAVLVAGTLMAAADALKRSRPGPSGNQISYRALNAACLTIDAKWRRWEWRMGLSAQQKELLEARYETWGLDRVRKELEKDDRDLFVHPDVTALARAWIEAMESGRRRARRSIMVLVIVGIVQLGVALALVL